MVNGVLVLFILNSFVNKKNQLELAEAFVRFVMILKNLEICKKELEILEEKWFTKKFAFYPKCEI